MILIGIILSTTATHSVCVFQDKTTTTSVNVGQSIGTETLTVIKKNECTTDKRTYSLKDIHNKKIISTIDDSDRPVITSVDEFFKARSQNDFLCTNVFKKYEIPFTIVRELALGEDTTCRQWVGLNKDLTESEIAEIISETFYTQGFEDMLIDFVRHVSISNDTLELLTSHDNKEVSSEAKWMLKARIKRSGDET